MNPSLKEEFIDQCINLKVQVCKRILESKRLHGKLNQDTMNTEITVEMGL
jgi:hypothetical protein